MASTHPSSTAPMPAEGPSLLEQMMAEGMKAQAVKDAKKKVENERMKTGFGSGLQGGFFSSPSPTTKSTSKSQEALGPSKGTSTKAGGEKSAGKDDIPLIKKNQEAKGMVLPEVQAAMQESTPPALRALQSGEWITPDLLEKMTSNPRLMAALQNPRCAAVLQEMQENPKVALAKYKDDPVVGPFLMDFCQLMGNHFTQLGAEEKEKEKEASQSTTSCQGAAPKGPLVEQALKKHQTSQGSRDADEEREQEEKVKQILADPELRSLLMDPDMQRILQECGQPGKLQLYMRDPVMSAKLRKLAEAGLVQIQR